ncbi:MFS general substrate transporter [Tricholoma matsutake]|nr:MFS general substrate transporter [Tricholoma matsutake 945]
MDDTRVVNENTSLLPGQHKNRTPTPLPWFQISIVLFLQTCEPIISLSIYPFINQLVGELDITGGDKRKVGYYAGLIESLFFATEAITILQWGRMSDRVGRKPILLIGLFGSSVSMICFGLSRTFWGLVLSRCLSGLLNGNIGVMKTVMGELTDSTNRAQAFPFMSIVWAIGVTIAPLVGGSLSRPHEHFPSVFGGPFWKQYPYFLPCLVSSSFAIVAFVVTLVFFKETVPKVSTAHATEQSVQCSEDNLVSLRQLLTFPVVLSVSNYTALAFLNITLLAIMPLFFTMPIELGGLGFTPSLIGYILGSCGVLIGLFQVFCFSRIVRYLGERSVFNIGMRAYLIVFTVLPVMGAYAQRFGVTFVVWILIGLVLVMMAFMDMAYACVFIYITASVPSKRSLGAVNGLSQTTVSIARAIGPALTTSLYSLSVEHKILGGYAVYTILFALSILGLLLGIQLPYKMWEEHDKDIP